MDPIPAALQNCSNLPAFVRLTGAFFYAGSLALSCRLIWEQTVWTWERGPQMVGFSLIHGAGAVLFLFPFLLAIWTVGVVGATLWSIYKKRRISRQRWAAIIAILLLFGVDSLPEGFWQRVFISRMAASPRAGDLMVYAAYRGDLGTVKGFITRGVSVNTRTRRDFRTALHGASVKGDIEAIRFLVATGADINALDRYGDSPLELAMAHNQEKAAGVLAALGAKRIKGDEAQREKAIRDQVRQDFDGSQGR